MPIQVPGLSVGFRGAEYVCTGDPVGGETGDTDVPFVPPTGKEDFVTRGTAEAELAGGW